MLFADPLSAKARARRALCLKKQAAKCGAFYFHE
jgi:hypothetical protein